MEFHNFKKIKVKNEYKNLKAYAIVLYAFAPFLREFNKKIVPLDKTNPMDCKYLNLRLEINPLIDGHIVKQAAAYVHPDFLPKAPTVTPAEETTELKQTSLDLKEEVSTPVNEVNISKLIDNDFTIDNGKLLELKSKYLDLYKKYGITRKSQVLVRAIPELGVYITSNGRVYDVDTKRIILVAPDGKFIKNAHQYDYCKLVALYFYGIKQYGEAELSNVKGNYSLTNICFKKVIYWDIKTDMPLESILDCLYFKNVLNYSDTMIATAFNLNSPYLMTLLNTGRAYQKITNNTFIPAVNIEKPFISNIERTLIKGNKDTVIEDSNKIMRTSNPIGKPAVKPKKVTKKTTKAPKVKFTDKEPKFTEIEDSETGEVIIERINPVKTTNENEVKFEYNGTFYTVEDLLNNPELAEEINTYYMILKEKQEKEANEKVMREKIAKIRALAASVGKLH